MIYIIDHQDSFTWNVVHQFSKFDKVICSNYFEINNKLLEIISNYLPDIIVFGHADLIENETIEFIKKNFPIFGIS